MWHLLLSARKSDAEFKISAEDLIHSTSRTLIVTMMLAYVLWHVCASQLWPETFGGDLWFVAFMFLPAGGLGLWLLRRSLLAANGTWLLGIAASVIVALYVFQDSQVVFLLAFLPLLAVVTIGVPAAIPIELLVIGLVWWVARTPDMPALSQTQQVLTALSGVVAGLIGWASASALTTTAEWSLRHFVQARYALKETQAHRAQLADMVKSLDQAYYRLERANAALVAARKEAEDAERFKTEFVTNVSHELRTPLNLIVGFSEVMMTAPESYDGVPLPGAYRSDLGAIYQAAQHLLALVDDILDMARIEAGKLSLVREHTDLNTLVHEAAATMRDYVNLKRLRLHLCIEPNLPLVRIDRLRIRQVILNLLVNAARFTERGSITIRVQSDDRRPATGDGQVEVISRQPSIVISVSDTGRGIPAEDLPKIFEAFRATEQPLSTWHSGTGLGLPISKQFIELHGGQMGVESQGGKGSMFWFTLPCESAVVPSDAQPRHHPYVPLGHTERIVVVVHEDERIASLVQRYLERFRVLHATNFDDAVQLAHEAKAIAILTDGYVPLPQPDTESLIVQCPLPNQREIALTLGVSEFLAKPVTRHELMAALDRVGRPIKTALIVDDDPQMVRLLQRMLRTQAGLEHTVAAHSGAEALDLLQSFQPDVVLLDLVMPAMDGMDGSAVLKQMSDCGLTDAPRGDVPPVIVISGHAGDHARLPLHGPIVMRRNEGFGLAELMRTLEVSFDALAPGWQKLEPTQTTPASAVTAPGSLVSSSNPLHPWPSPVPAGA